VRRSGTHELQAEKTKLRTKKQQMVLQSRGNCA
jgi:hypothetical protein